MKAIALGQLDPDQWTCLYQWSCLFAGLYGYGVLFTHGAHDGHLEGGRAGRVTQGHTQEGCVRQSLQTCGPFMLNWERCNPDVLFPPTSYFLNS